METNQDNFNAKIDGITRLTDSVCDPESNYNSHRHSATSADLLRKLKVYRCWLVFERIELIRYRDEELEPLFGGNGIDFREDTIECRRYGFIQANLGKIEEIEPIVNGAITRLEQYLQTLVPVVTQSETTALSLPQQLKTNLNDTQRERLFEELIQGGFIDNDTDKASFLWAFGGDVQPTQYVPIMWTAYNSTTKKHYLSKKSLLNLLDILSVSFEQIRDRKLLSVLFVDPNAEPLKYSAANYLGKWVSEYNQQLINIVQKAKG